MEFRDLEFFEVIATVGHLGRAAERLDRTQPALSKCIDRLEKQIGTHLFEPAGRGLRLTSTGEMLLQQAKTMRLAMEENLRQLANHASGSAGLVKIGAGPTAAEHRLPAFLQRLFAASPDVAVSLTIGSSDFLRTLLRDGQVDLIIGPISDHDASEFCCLSLASDEMVVAAGIRHPLAGKPASLADLSRYKWLLPHRPIIGRIWLEQVFERAGLARPDVQVESNSLLYLLPLVAETDLLTYVSHGDLGYGRANGILEEVHVPEAMMRRHLGVVHNRHVALSPLARRFLDMLEASRET